MQPLTPREQVTIKRDFERILERGSEAVMATFSYLEGSAAIVDEVYGTASYSDEETLSVTGMVLQEFIKPRNEKILAYGILDTQDCILYASTSLDLSVGHYDSMEITVENVKWRPVPRDQRAFYQYTISRIGISQIAQVIPCKLLQ